MAVMKKSLLNKVLLILIAFIVYSVSSIFSKLASQHEFLSLPYVLFFCGVVASLGIYALLWQKVLAFMQLNKAFLCKSITIIFILAISVFLFGEQVSMNNLIGAGLIISGLVVLAWKK